VIGFVLLGPTVIRADDLPTKPGQHVMQFAKNTEAKIEIDYLLYLPEGYQPDGKRWPVLFFLHGAGERGEDLNKVKRHGPPKIVGAGHDLPFVVVSPQSRRFGWQVDLLDSLLDEILANYQVDPDRVYLTGLSMGGFGTWAWAIERPDRFAALVPICAGGRPDDVAVLRDTPVWAFHGGKDPVVALERGQAMVDALKKAGGNVKFTVYPEAGHDAWTKTYDNPELYRWLLKQRRDKQKAAKK